MRPLRLFPHGPHKESSCFFSIESSISVVVIQLLFNRAPKLNASSNIANAVPACIVRHAVCAPRLDEVNVVGLPLIESRGVASTTQRGSDLLHNHRADAYRA